MFDKIALKVQAMEKMEAELTGKAKVVQFNFDLVKNKEFILEVLQRIENLEKENETLKTSLQEITNKYTAELQSKNDLIQSVLDKQTQMNAANSRLQQDKEQFELYKTKSESLIQRQRQQIHQELRLIENEKQLLFQRLNNNDLETSILSLKDNSFAQSPKNTEANLVQNQILYEVD